ncbi:hypothetical protein B0H17DRAFT_1131908 [Mycena rosella]|uniref:Uncharacterized protein n=1 Tax=Mycena rosella TaxID=1033263 RepID=A0AAD7GH80_MYCRO|nr:hypothetical protein B0H17DRAFT_1131908 [Mycena rosella]
MTVRPSTHFTARFADLERLVAELDASSPAALAFSVYSKHFLPAPDSAGKASTHIFANEYEEPFESIIFGCVCRGAIAQISFAVQSDFPQGLQANRFPKIKALRLMALALIVDNVRLSDLQINTIHLHSASIASASGLARVDLT